MTRSVRRVPWFLVWLLGVGACGGQVGQTTFDGSTGTTGDGGVPLTEAGQPNCTGADQDGDGVPDACDNCPDVANADQARSFDNTGGDACTWPNQVSSVNSDPWLVAHHDDLRTMRPRVLVINFANGRGQGGGDNVNDGPLTGEMLKKGVDYLLGRFREASRFHAYRDPSARPFIDPVLVKIVDLQDNNGHANSSLFPRGATTDQGYPLVGYHRLFGEAFAEHLGFDDGGRFLTLTELVNRGMIHEVLMVANQVEPNKAPADQVTSNILEVATCQKAYDSQLRPLDAYIKNGIRTERQTVDTTHGGTGEDHNTMPWIGRTLRINFVNAVDFNSVEHGHGPGHLHPLIHLLEFMHNESAIYAPGQPYDGAAANAYLRPYFRRFATFDLRERGFPFDSFYAGGNDYGYADCNPACSTVTYPGGQVSGFRMSCGNAHYSPGAERGYENGHANQVLSDCETFMEPDSGDVAVGKGNWTGVNTHTRDDPNARFYLWWFQSQPGVKNRAVDPQGNPMKNWWVFLYY